MIAEMSRDLPEPMAVVIMYKFDDGSWREEVLPYDLDDLRERLRVIEAWSVIGQAPPDMPGLVAYTLRPFLHGPN